MSIVYDLHSHSSCSDGSLSPEALVELAHENGVDVLALTDHDCLAGIESAQLMANSLGMTLIPGVEISTSWRNRELHIVGLNIDTSDKDLIALLESQQQNRIQRAKKIGDKLAKKKIVGVWEEARRLAGSDIVTRAHFARVLVERGVCQKMQQAFDRYLGQGKAAYVSTEWAELEQVISHIHQAKGVAVLAHPHRYVTTGAWRRRMYTAFKSAGGDAIEVVCAGISPQTLHQLASDARTYQFHGSCGSDFHSPENTWIRLGRLAEFPIGVRKVWDLF